MIDCGAFDGDTAIAFSKKCPTYCKIYALEPDSERLKQLKANTQSLQIEIIPKGAYSSKTTLYFENIENGCSKISQQGIKISTDCIDDIVKNENNPITFIKMDIEGSELEALKGAEQTIKKWRPKLAICVYHKKDDLIEIPKIIKSFNQDYRLYLRNHQCVPEDTVLYAF